MDPNPIRWQRSRWVRAGQIYPLRRGVYALAPPYHRLRLHPFVVANSMDNASYVSCQSTMAFYELIAEFVPVVISVTTNRPARWATPLGNFAYRHVRSGLFAAYQWSPLGPGEFALVARLPWA